jgi:hypothetical protein
MEDSDIIQPSIENQLPGKPSGSMEIVGYNLLALASYTLLCKFSSDAGYIFDAVVLALHVLFCLIASIAYKNWLWLLSGIMVLIIGISTCVYIPPFR